ncbi:MAG TPA: sn-glycerol-3-phosphate ABC transporter ATP-binding protein UgpC [Piscinibacter sp.]|nr:sn-glycerol-3-phosphate ABC transporter ATP-binding protein UgpC [Piscinibacter sp.]HNW63149.1 sn-glycerol-3-phosphate ABC transporter ATP-binding protein UgpC [Piscinibacter sp.]HOY35562.1 sn-glycerol-3-phosphate ABC transporter ATP-binding protein UgpC [Piscinibacter sp.]
MAEVNLSGIEKVYPNGFKAVHGVDLTVRDGEFMVFVGPSGCAKSTLLRMVAGLESISGGELRIGDRVVNNVAAKERGVAMVFQNYALYPHMTVFDNLAFGLKMTGVPKAEIGVRVKEAAQLLEMEQLLERYPRQLSGGQAQRVAVGRAIVKKPAVFLFDEPLSNLDAKLRGSMRVRLTDLHRTLRESGHAATVIYVTHDQVEAMTMGERICVLKDGMIQQVDTPARIYEKPANVFVAGFVGSPEMNLHDVEVRHEGGQPMLHWGGLAVAPGGAAMWNLRAHSRARVVFGLRPEHVLLNPTASDCAALPGTLRSIENTGSEVHVHCDIGGLPFACRAAPEALGELAGKRRGESHIFHLRMDACHVFDPDTGANLLD